MKTTKATAEQSTAPRPFFYRPSEAARLIGIGRTTLYAWEKTGRFPARVNLASNVSGWLASDIEQWLSQKAATAS